MEKINVGVIGCGYWGPNIIRNLCEVPDARIVSCCDKRVHRLEFIKQRFPFLTTCMDHADILADPSIDALVIATPIATHFDLAQEALLSGKHVLVEKPLAQNIQYAKTLIALARTAKKVLMVGHTYEYTGAVNKMKEIVQSGEIGEIYYFEAARVHLGGFHAGSNVIWDLGPHDVSIANYLLGALPESIIAVGASHIRNETPNVVYATFNYPNTMIGHIHLSWLSPVKFRRIVVGGSRKMIVFDDVEPIEKVKVYDAGINDLDDPKGLLDHQLVYRTGDIYSPKLDSTEPLKVECTDFIASIRDGIDPRSNGESGLKTVRVLQTIEASVKNLGSRVKLLSE